MGTVSWMDSITDPFDMEEEVEGVITEAFTEGLVLPAQLIVELFGKIDEFLPDQKKLTEKRQRYHFNPMINSGNSATDEEDSNNRLPVISLQYHSWRNIRKVIWTWH